MARRICWIYFHLPPEATDASTVLAVGGTDGSAGTVATFFFGSAALSAGFASDFTGAVSAASLEGALAGAGAAGFLEAAEGS